MGALAVFHEDEVPIELGVAGKLADLAELGLADLALFHGVGQLFGQELQLIADGVGARLDLFLGRANLGNQILVALGALVLDQLRVVQRADQVMAAIGHAVGLGLGGHMAVGAGVGGAVLAALAQIGLELGVLDLDLLHAGAEVGVIHEHVAVGEVGAVVEESQHRGRVHALDGVVGDPGFLGDGVEVILVVALAAGHVGGVHAVEVAAQGVDPVGMGHGDGAGGIGVAVVAADALDDVLLHVGPGVLVGLHALLVDHVGEVRRLAGPAVGHRVRPSGLLDVDHVVVMASGAAVAEGEAVGLIQRGQHRVLLQIVHDLVALAGHVPALVDLRVFLGPVGGVQYRDARVGLHLRGDLLNLDQRAAEVGGVQSAALEGVEHGGLDAVGRQRGAGDGVHLQTLRVIDRLGHGQDGARADALGLLVLDDLDLVDMVVGGGDLHGDVAVAAHGGARQMQGAGGHLAVGHAGLPSGRAGGGVDRGDRDNDQRAQNGHHVVLAQLFPNTLKLLGKFHFLPPPRRAGASSYSPGPPTTRGGARHSPFLLYHIPPFFAIGEPAQFGPENSGKMPYCEKNDRERLFFCLFSSHFSCFSGRRAQPTITRSRAEKRSCSLSFPFRTLEAPVSYFPLVPLFSKKAGGRLPYSGRGRLFFAGRAEIIGRALTLWYTDKKARAGAPGSIRPRPEERSMDRELRRCSSQLRILGLGLLVLTVWDLIKPLLYLLLAPDEMDSIRVALPWYNRTLLVVTVVMVVLIMGMALAMRLRIGFSAMAEGAGKTCKKGYVVLAFFYFVLQLAGMRIFVRALLLQGLQARDLMETVSAAVMDLCSVCITGETVVTALRLHRLRRRRAS